MISESQLEQAALHALGLLDADEAAAFERAMTADPELAQFTRELRDAAAGLARAAADGGATATAPAGLRARVMGAIAAETRSAATKDAPNVIRPRFGWVPWTIAALLLGCASLLAVDRASIQRQLSEARQAVLPPPANSSGDPLTQVAFCELEPTPDAPVKPRAAVLWDAKRHKGVLRVTQLAPATDGKDYQLWAVEAARKEPVNAGVVHVDAEGRADVPFEPEPISGDNKVVALAISLERAGGSPTNQGPILFLGKL